VMNRLNASGVDTAVGRPLYAQRGRSSLEAGDGQG
jgi:hypothetical protein